MDIEKLRKRVIEVKKKNDWTFRKMAEMSGIHNSMLQKFVSGIDPHKKTAVKIAKAFYPNFEGLNRKEEPVTKVNSNQLSIMKWGLK